MTRAITREVRFAHSRERVWAAIASSEALAKWMYPNNFEPRIGHQFTFRVPAKPEAGFSGLVVECQVLECEPPHLLVFSWTVGGPVVDTRVSFRLESDGDATLMYFEHAGFDLTQSWAEKALKGAEYGWAAMLKTLKEVLSSLNSRSDGEELS